MPSSPRFTGPFSVREGEWRTRLGASLTTRSILNKSADLLCRAGFSRPGSFAAVKGPAVKDQETVEKFIELRAQGASFRSISQQLGVAPGTLVNWSRQHQHLIHNLRAIEWEDFLDRTLASRQQRVQSLAERLRRIETELAGRDLAAVPTVSLQAMAEQLHRRLERESAAPRFSAGVQLSRDDESREAVEQWPA